jgi:hypothetical protein
MRDDLSVIVFDRRLGRVDANDRKICALVCRERPEIRRNILAVDAIERKNINENRLAA